MKKNTILQNILQHRILIAARGLKEDEVLHFCEAILAGGLHLIEIPYNQLSPTALTDVPRQIESIRAHFGDSLAVGAGTVLTCAQVKAAADAGASFILSPSLDANVIQETLAHSLVSIPGVMTPTEAQNAMLWGADMVKIFPTGVLGISYLKAIRVPLNHIPMIAMGGANEENLKDFLQVCEGVGIGNALCNRALLDEKNYSEISRRAKAFSIQLESL